MTEAEALKDYLGIPRREIPWYPAIDRDLCSDCGVCVKSCKHGTFAFGDTGEVAVANPYHCEVFCQSCSFACPEEAISFPDRKTAKGWLKELRKTYPPAE
jgi:NAD-dependent dihydropyrimidine dehydrogenase PreA subunit